MYIYNGLLRIKKKTPIVRSSALKLTWLRLCLKISMLLHAKASKKLESLKLRP